MSKRFGRNQKRKLKQRVVELEALLHSNRSRTDKLERAAADITRMFTEHAAFAPVRLSPGHGPLWASRVAGSHFARGSLLEHRITELNALRSVIFPVPTENAFDVHMLVNDDRGWSYRFSGKIFEQALPPTATREICEQMTRQMLAFVEKQWSHMMALRPRKGF